MSKFLAITWGIVWRTLAFSLVVGAGLWWMNRDTGWDGRKAYETQVGQPTGRVGVAVVALAMPERYDHVFFENFLDKIFTGTIPWPINVLAGADAGVVLADPNKPMPDARFEPKELVDVWGRSADVDGVPWVEKYKKGYVRYVKAGTSVADDYGYFLYPKRKGGIRTVTAKLLIKARYVMYNRLPNGYLPHYSQTIAMAQSAADALKQRHNLAAAEVVEAFDPWKMEVAVRRILDSGVDTFVLSSVQPIYSDFEELRGSYSKVYKFIDAWRKENPGKQVKVLIAPYMASSSSFDTLWVNHLLATAPPAPEPGKSTAHVILSLHGLPTSLINSDSWDGHATETVARMSPLLEAAMKTKGYRDVKVIRASEGFADPPEDNGNELLSVREAYDVAVRDKVDVAIALPLEFMAENTDMLFTHAAIMFKGMPGYSSYEGPPADVDWSKPFVRSFKVDQTQVIYSGAPGGAAAPAAGLTLADAVSPMFAR